MDWEGYLFAVCIGLFIFGSLLFVFPKLRFWSKKPSNTNNTSTQAKNKQLQLAAYERLILLTDRIALPNLIAREALPNLSAREMQLFLAQNLKQEFEYNITQQLYVSNDSWNSVKNLRDQNLLIINQIGNAMPANATGTDLNRSILEFLLNDKRGSLPELVSEVLSYEAKKLM
jgi:hypothetical protein